MKNIFKEIPQHLPEELIEVLSKKDSIKIERIISRGHSSPKNFWYNQEMDEFVILLSGSAIISFDTGESFNIKKGDYLIIPAHQKHRVEKTDSKIDSIWLAVHF